MEIILNILIQLKVVVIFKFLSFFNLMVFKTLIKKMIFKSAVRKFNEYVYLSSIILLHILTIPAITNDNYLAFIAIVSIHVAIIIFLIRRTKPLFTY